MERTSRMVGKPGVVAFLLLGAAIAVRAQEIGAARCFYAGFEAEYAELPVNAGPAPLREGTPAGSWIIHNRAGSIIKQNDAFPGERTYLLFRGADTASYSMEAVFSEQAVLADGVLIEFDVRVLRSGTVDQWRNFIRVLDESGQSLVHFSISGHQDQFTRLAAWDPASGAWRVLTEDLQPATTGAPHPVDGWDRIQIEMNAATFDVRVDLSGSGAWGAATPDPVPYAPAGAKVASILFEAGDPGARIRYDQIAAIKPFALFDWSAVAHCYPDIQYHYLQTNDPRPLRIHALRADLGNPDIRLHTTPRHASWGDPAPDYPQYTIRTARQPTPDYVIENRAAGRNMVAAVNAAPWLPWPELPDWHLWNWHKANYPYADELGLAVSDGVLVCPANARPSLVFYRDWTAGIEESPAGADLEMVLTAVSGFGFALRDGALQGTWMDAEPRTGVGLCAERRFLLLMAIDGRRPGVSEGAPVPEVGMFLRFFGAWDGLNMDGGGSTTMALLDPANSQVSVVNNPATTVLEGSARTVGNNLGIYYIGEPEPVEYDDWMRYRGVPESARDVSFDASGDGIANLWAYAWNIHPLKGVGEDDPGARPAFTMRTGSEGTPALSVSYRQNRHAIGLDVQVQVTDDLQSGSWQIPDAVQTEELDPDPATRDRRVEVEVDGGANKTLFMRLRAVLDEP